MCSDTAKETAIPFGKHTDEHRVVISLYVIKVYIISHITVSYFLLLFDIYILLDP